MDNNRAQNVSDASGLQRFFSLKWKALLFTSLVLIVVTVTISWRSYSNLNAQFDGHRRAAHDRYERDMRIMIGQSLDGLLKLGGVIPSLPGMQEALAIGNPGFIRARFDPQWPVLQFDWAIDSLAFYDVSGALLASWKVAEWEERHNAQILGWIRQVNASEIPVLALHCDRECLRYAALPVLAQGNSAGVVLISSSLADVVRDFSEVSANDIGLFVAGGECVQADRIAQWDGCIFALTQKEQNLQMLRQTAVPLASVIEGVRSELNGRSFEIKLTPVPEYAGSNPAYLVVIADITETLSDIRGATQEVFIFGGLGWLLSELLLLLILWTPMSRLRLTAGNLPLLAQSRFDAVREAISGRARKHFVDDEIDILDDTAIALADRLEQLEEDVEQHTKDLSNRMEELARERDFVASLLNIAQVMIVTQDRQGRMVMVNPFVCSLTGYGESDLIGSNFVEQLIVQRQRDLRSRLQQELAIKKRAHLRHESLVACKDGSIRNVTWYHSRLKGRFTGDPVILSVGLDNTERRGAESRLAWMADHDTLTGLINRRRFQEELALALAAAQRQNKTGALLLIDLDQFKYINDTSGHYNGDTVLKAVATALCEDSMPVDVVARLGGDEFAVLVREADAKRAVRVAESVNAAIGAAKLEFDGQILRLSASVGIVLFPDFADNVGDLMACADFAMYQAKEQGRGYWCLFSQDDKTRERMRHRVYWREKVSQALAEDRFVLYFQPIMEIASGEVSHYEILLRMRDEDGSIIGPAHFIDVAERSGMIHAVDRLVVSKAARYWAELKRQGKEITFSINLSGHAFTDPQLLPHISRELERYGVDTAKIIFEITETAAVSDFAVASNMMLAVKALGCRFALDDFGIGFSSFYYLKHLPVDYLKIDGSFIRQLPDSLDDQIIVRAITQVASGFGKQIIAEYVETESTLQLLREYGIDFAQGYLVSRPLAGEQVFSKNGPPIAGRPLP